MKKWNVLVILLVALQLTLSCSKKADIQWSDDIDTNGTLNMQLASDPALLNPVLSTDSTSSAVESLIFSGLLRTNTKLDLEPDLAESYTISKDGRVYTFKLKKNVRWHDGHPFTADDVKFTLDKILDKKTNTVRRSSYVIEGKPVKIKIVDSHTVQFILHKPFAPFITNIAMDILPKHLLENDDINTTDFNRHPIGTGPFKFKTWQPSQHILLERNDDYYGPKAKLKQILLKIIPNPNTALVALKKGEIDEVSIPPKDYDKIVKDGRFNVFTIETLSYTFMGFNLKNPHFKHKKVRQAIVHAINRESLINNVYKGFGKPAHLPSSPVSWAYPDAENLTTFDYDPEKSRQLLKEAGFVLNTQSNILEKAGQEFAFTLITNKDNKEREKMAQFIQRFLLDVGIKVDIQLMEWQSFVKKLNDVKDPKDFDAVMLGWSLGLDPDGFNIWHSQEYPKGFNFIGYKNPRVDILLEKGRSETVKEKRKAIYKELFSLIAQDSPYAFLLYPESISAYSKRVRGLAEPGPAGLMNPMENVYVVKPKL